MLSQSNIEQFNITGTEFNDSFRGLDHDDTIVGGAGNDSINGYGGNDRIDGGAGNDSINSGAGNDTFAGGSAGDTIDGGEGMDSLASFNASDATIDININSNDPINLEYGNTSITNIESIGNLTTGSGNDSFVYNSASSASGKTVNGGEGDDTLTVDYTGYERGINNTQINDRRFYDPAAGANASLLLQSNIEQFNITGTEFNDSFRGLDHDDTIVSGAGNDTIDGYGGNDRIDGGAGNDSINSGTGSDLVFGVDRDDENAGVGEIDTLAGGANGDRFILGDNLQIFYDDNNADEGEAGYARITDFDAAQGDVIQLHGSKSDYRLADSPLSNVAGTALYLITEGEDPDELIAILQGATGLDLSSDAFVEAEEVTAPAIVGFASDSYSVNEENETAEITIALTGRTTGVVNAEVILSNGTASAQDYDNTPIQVSFAEGETTKTINVPIVNDELFEADETIALSLSTISQNTVIAQDNNNAILTIISEDIEPAGELSFAQIHQSINENNVAELVITLNRSGGANGEVNVTVNLADVTAIAPDDYDSTPIVVTFANGEISKTFTVPVVNDELYEDTENLILTLAEPTGGATLGSLTSTNLSIRDDDAVPGVLAFSGTEYSVREDGTAIAAVTIIRTGGSDGAVSARISSTDGSATSPDDYASGLSTITFANGETSKTVEIPLVNDRL